MIDPLESRLYFTAVAGASRDLLDFGPTVPAIHKDVLGRTVASGSPASAFIAAASGGGGADIATPTTEVDSPYSNVASARTFDVGDINGDRRIADAADYFLIDNGFLNHLSGYHNGDLNGDGKVDAADYFVIDQAYLNRPVPDPFPA